MSSKKVISELRHIAAEHRGLLRPRDIVRAARPKSSPLHSRFLWDDTKAAEQYRLWQAEKLIRVTIDVLDADDKETSYRTFVSLAPDRKRQGGGYRSMMQVLQNPRWRAQLLADAKGEMDLFAAKYIMLQELAEVIDAMRKVGSRIKAA